LAVDRFASMSGRTRRFLLSIEQFGYVPDADDPVGACTQRLATVGGKGALGQRDIGDLVTRELAAGVEVPHAELMKLDIAREGVSAVGCDRKGTDRASVALEAANFPAGIEIPERADHS
jgi:hypothetical protein